MAWVKIYYIMTSKQRGFINMECASCECEITGYELEEYGGLCEYCSIEAIEEEK